MKLILLLFFSLLASSLSAKERIDWRVIDWPPFYIFHGEDRGSGVYDGLIDYFGDRLPEYEHHFVEMTTERIREQWKKGENVCHPSVIVDQPLNFRGFNDDGTAVISKVNSILLSHELILKASKANEIASKPVDLEEVLSNKNLLGGVSTSRYNAGINKLVEKYSGQPHLLVKPVYKTLNRMFASGRLDYVIEYSPVFNYLRHKEKDKIKQPISYFPIKMSKADSFILVAVGCTDNEWGRKIIKKINVILTEESKKKDFLENRLRWYTESQRELLRDLYREFYFHDKM